MRDTYVPLFQDILTSSIWAHPDLEVRLAWIFFMAKADEEGFVSGTVPGLAQQAHVSADGMRRAIAAFESPDPDSRSPDHDGRRLERVPRGWRVINIVAMRDRAKAEAERARKRRWAQEHRARGGDYETREAEPVSCSAPSNEEAKQEAFDLAAAPDCDPEDREVAPVDAVSTLRSEPVDARKRKRTRIPLSSSPPPLFKNREEGEEEQRPTYEAQRFYDLEGFVPSAELVGWFERYGLPPMALHERLRKVRLAKVAIGGKNGVDDREEWCRLQAPRWKKWWLDDGGRAEPLPVQRRQPPRPSPAASSPAVGMPMPEALLRFVTTGQLPQLPPKAGAEVAA